MTILQNLFISKINDIKIKRNVSRFLSSTRLSPFYCSPFPILLLFCPAWRLPLVETKLRNQSEIWVIWCKLLTPFSKIQSCMHRKKRKRTRKKMESYHFLSNAINFDKGILRNPVIGTNISITFCGEKYSR